MQFYHSEIRQGLFRISSHDWDTKKSTNGCWMVVGTEKALLIDAGEASTGLKEYAKSVACGRPVQLALTHGHFDHTGALDEFDEFYMNPADKYLLQGGAGLPGTVYHGELISVRTGDVFELGERCVKCFEAAGHTPGSICYLDTKTKTLISGDSVARRGLFLERCSIADYFDVLLKLEALDYDSVASAHDGFLLPKSQTRHFITVMVNGICNPDGGFRMPGGQWMSTIHYGTGVEDPEYVSISFPKEDEDTIRAELEIWKKRNSDWNDEMS